MEKRQKVVIIGHGYTSRLAVIRSVGQIGCEVTVIVMVNYQRFSRKLNTKKPIDCYSKYVNHVFYCYANDEEGLIQLLLNKCTDSQKKVVIIPDSDFSAAVIDKNQKRLAEHFLYQHIFHTPGAIVEWMGKMKQKELARDIGLKVASSRVINVIKRHYDIPADVRYPCFTKPLATFNGGGKLLLRRCNNEAELRTVLNLAGSIADMEVLVEDFKTIETEYALVGFSDGKEVVIPGIVQILEMAHGGHFGVACKGKVMPVAGFENLVSKFKLFVKKIGFVGVFDIDFYRSGGEMYFVEMNLRFGGSGYAMTKMGVNLPGMLVKYLCCKSIDSMQQSITSSGTYVNERMCLDDWISGYISWREYEKMVKSADISFINDSFDPGPQQAYDNYRRQARLIIKRVVKLLLRKKERHEKN